MGHKRDASVFARYNECKSEIVKLSTKGKTKLKFHAGFSDSRDGAARESYKNSSVIKLLTEDGYTVQQEPTIEEVLQNKLHQKGVNFYLMVSWKKSKDE